MSIFIAFFISFWLVRSIKAGLFYLYLWQLKEYHFSRFISHFETDSGKKLFINKWFAIKLSIFIISLVLLYTESFYGGKPILTFLFVIVLLIYAMELVTGIKNLLQKSLKVPVFTVKAIFLSALYILVIFIILLISAQISDPYAEIFVLFTTDILGLFIASLVVLFVQPFIVLYRNIFVLDKAKKIIEARKDLITIGITGSYGKTTTKEFLATLLSEKFKVLKTTSHQNSEMGISDCIIKNLTPEHQIFVVEMGAYGKGGIKLLSSIAKPQIGILTGINSQHISLFGSQEIIKATKYELIEALPESGLAVFNGDNEFCVELYNKTTKFKKIYKTNSDQSSDVWAENIKVQKDKLVFTVNAKGGQKKELVTNVLGGQNISNLLAAITVALYLGLTIDEIAKGVSKITADQGPIKMLGKSQDPYYIDSTYSANPDGVLADLEYLKTWEHHKAVIMPCLIELGPTASEIHYKIGKKIGEICDLVIITSTEYYEDIRKGALEAGMTEDKIFCLESTEEILNQIKIFASLGDVVLLESRVPAKLLTEIEK